MIEIAENIVQMSILLICACVSAVWAIRAGKDRNREKSETSGLLFLFYALYLVADLYWTLYLVFYHEGPRTFYVSELCWYVADLLLFMLVRELADPKEKTIRSPALFALPAFCAAMCLFYMQWGDYSSNIICAVLMSLLTYHAARGLVYMHSNPQKAANLQLCIVVLIFCGVEYCMWTASCFWSGDAWTNPYFFFDFLLTVTMLFMLPAYRKAVAK